MSLFSGSLKLAQSKTEFIMSFLFLLRTRGCHLPNRCVCHLSTFFGIPLLAHNNNITTTKSSQIVTCERGPGVVVISCSQHWDCE